MNKQHEAKKPFLGFIQHSYWFSSLQNVTQGISKRENQVQIRSPHTPGTAKNALGPAGIPLKRGASGAMR